MNARHVIIPVAASLTLSANSYAQTPAASPAARPPAPCASDLNSHKFDFWIGEWDVSPAGATAIVGHSTVQSISGGCALLENWTATNGSDGKSINAYNRGTHQWQQFWAGSGGAVTEYRESTWRGDTLVFLAHSNAPQGPFLQRLSFSRLDANTVRQFGETSVDDGTTWTVGYDFRYHRAK